MTAAKARAVSSWGMDCCHEVAETGLRAGGLGADGGDRGDRDSEASPVKSGGQGGGGLDEAQACQREAPRRAMSLRRSGSTPPSASSVVHDDREEADERDDDELRASGRSRARRPAAGRSATIGIVWEAMSSGYRPRRSAGRTVQEQRQRRRRATTAISRPRPISRAVTSEVVPQQAAVVAQRTRATRSAPAGGTRRCAESACTPASRRAKSTSDERRAASARAVSSAGQRAGAHGDDRRVGGGRGRAEVAPRCRRRPVPGRGDRTTTRSASSAASSTSWVTSSTVRGRAPSAPASHAAASARVMRVERAEGLVEAQHGRARQQRAQQRRPAGACRRESCAGRAARSRRGRARSSCACARSRAWARGVPATRSASAALSSAVGPREQQVALRHEHGARPRRSPCRRRAAAGRRRDPAASICRSREAPTTATTSPARARQRQAVERGDVPVAAGRRDGRASTSDAAGSCDGSGAVERRLVTTSLPPRALPHRFEGSAPDDGRTLSRPDPPSPLVSLPTEATSRRVSGRDVAPASSAP